MWGRRGSSVVSRYSDAIEQSKSQSNVDVKCGVGIDDECGEVSNEEEFDFLSGDERIAGLGAKVTAKGRTRERCIERLETTYSLGE